MKTVSIVLTRFRLGFQDSLVLLFLVVVGAAVRHTHETNSCPTLHEDHVIENRDVVPQLCQDEQDDASDSDAMSMLQSVGAVQVRGGRASVHTHQASRPQLNEASISTMITEEDFKGYPMSRTVLPQKWDLLHASLLEQIQATNSGGILFFVMVFVTLFSFILIRGFFQAERKSQQAPASSAPPLQDGASGETVTFPSPPTKPASSLRETPPASLPQSDSWEPPSEMSSPICPALVMRECEARLLIPKHALPQMVAGGDLVIFGLSGNPLLHAFIREGDRPGCRLLQLSMWHDVGTPCASIRLPDRSMPKTLTGCEILGPDNALYGMMRVRSGGSCVVVQKGIELMVIDGEPTNLQLTINSVTGTSLAIVQCNNGASGGVEHVVIKVGQGNDVVLIVACTLAVILMSANSSSMQ